MALPVVKKEILASFNKSNKPPHEIIQDIDKNNPVLSFVLCKYVSLCEEKMQPFIISGIAMVYGLLESQAEADDLNSQWKD